MTIALIEDDEAALESLRLLLEGRGLRVCGFASAEAFLAGLNEDQPECVVSDVRLPGLSGLDLQRALKAQGSDVPIILITGHGDIAMAVTAMKEGAFDFVEKPYNAERPDRRHREGAGRRSKSIGPGKASGRSSWSAWPSFRRARGR